MNIPQRIHYELCLERTQRLYPVNSYKDVFKSWGITEFEDEDKFLAQLNDFYYQQFRRDPQGFLGSVVDPRADIHDIEKFQKEVRMTISNLVAHHFMFYEFERNHKKIYDISNDLATMLYNTELKNVLCEMIKPPFEFFYLAFPDNLFFIDNPVTGLHRAYGVYIYHIAIEDEAKTEDIGRYLKKINSQYYKTDAEGHLRYPKEHWGFMVCAKPNENSIDEGDDAIYRFGFPVYEEHKYIEEAMKDWKSRQKGDKNVERIEGIFNFILNCLLYITGVDCDVKYINTHSHYQKKMSSLKSPAKRRKLEKFNRLPRYYLGTSIVLTREERADYTQHRGTGTKISTRTLVQGHWRNQAYGEKFSQRKHIWIRPFWRGPELGEIIHRKHVVQ